MEFLAQYNLTGIVIGIATFLMKIIAFMIVVEKHKKMRLALDNS